MRRSALVLAPLVLASAQACAIRHEPADDAATTDTPEPDAPPFDAPGAVCGCLPGPHDSLIYLLSDDAELWSYDPVADVFAYVIGPVCATTESPYSMGVDPMGRAWILYTGIRRVYVFDLLSPGPCTDSGFLPTNPDFPLFGMGFVSPHADSECASLFVQSYSESGAFTEAPGVGRLGVMEGTPLAIRTLAADDFDGGEVSGTGDGRVFVFGGTSPAKLVEHDRTTGAAIDTLALDGVPTTNANAFAFFAGDFYLFTEALPADCGACFEATCPAAWTACQADPTCTDQIACAIERGDVSDACGGGASPEMVTCLGTCTDACLTRPRARVSQVTRVDWDRSEGPDRTWTVVRTDAPIRVVGAGTSPCVPTVPF